MSEGRFITFEGGEGAGKSTHIQRLADALRGVGHDVLTTREPGGSDGAEAIRELLVRGEVGRWPALSEALLHCAARHDHVSKVLRPALADGRWVLCDRFIDSTVAYQGFGLGLDPAALAPLNALAADGLVPDLTLVLDLPPALGLERVGGRGAGEDRYERMDADFHGRVRAGFLDIARRESKRCALIEASGSIAATEAAILAAVRDRLGVKFS